MKTSLFWTIACTLGAIIEIHYGHSYWIVFGCGLTAGLNGNDVMRAMMAWISR